MANDWEDMLRCTAGCASVMCLHQNYGAYTEAYRCTGCGRTFRMEEGMLKTITTADVQRFGWRREVARAIYARFYTPITNGLFALACGGADKARREITEAVEFEHGEPVLETGVGTGDNISALGERVVGSVFVGVDNQLRMLRQCAKRRLMWGGDVRLVYANAERLPFRDGYFGSVIHVGAMNLFSDQRIAIAEMVRVAKPGARIVIADEDERGRALFSCFAGHLPPSVPPVEHLPPNAREVDIRSIWNDYGYLLTFRA